MANILVVDDSDIARLVISHILRRDQHTIYQAISGLAAKEMLQTELIDLLVTDIYMEEMGGVELVDWLRQSPDLQHLPVIMLTGSGEYNNQSTKNPHQADAILTKPVSSWELLALTNQLLGASI